MERLTKKQVEAKIVHDEIMNNKVNSENFKSIIYNIIKKYYPNTTTNEQIVKDFQKETVMIKKDSQIEVSRTLKKLEKEGKVKKVLKGYWKAI